MTADGLGRLIAVVALGAALLSACSDAPPAAQPRVPSIIGRVVDVDAPERVDGGFAGELTLTLADGTTVDVPRGTRYDGPNCTFIDDSGQSAPYREGRTECAINAVVAGGEVVAVVGIGVDDSGGPHSQPSGTLVKVNREIGYVADQFGYAFVWREEPFVDCDVAGVASLDDPALIEHGAVFLLFDQEGWLIGLECGVEG